MNTYGVVIENKVVNVVLWNGESEWTHLGDAVAIPEDSSAGIDWEYIDGEFVDNRPLPEEE